MPTPKSQVAGEGWNVLHVALLFRALVIFVGIAIVTTYWGSFRSHNDIGFLIGFTILGILLNIPYMLIFSHSNNKSEPVALCLTIDVILIVAGIHLLGGLNIFYAVYVYILATVFSHFYLERRKAWIVTGLAVACYLTMLITDRISWRTGNAPNETLPGLPEGLDLLVAAFNVALMILIGRYSGLISERLRNKDRVLEDARERLHMKERMSELGRFTADAAHAFKTPVALLTLRLKRIRTNQARRESIGEELNHMEAQIEHLRNLVSDLFKLYGPQELSRRKVNLNNLLEMTCALVAEQGAAKPGIEVHKELEHPLPAVEGDFSQLQYAFLNLIVNAIEAMPGNGRLSIHTENKKDFVESRISDTGCILSPDEMINIFRPFYTTKREQNGTGLGLAISRRIFELHGGFIQVRRKPPTGTEFVVSIPITRRINRLPYAPAPGDTLEHGKRQNPDR